MAKKGIWTGIVEGLPIQPFNKMEDLQWQMDAEVLKTGGAQAFVNRMNTWGPTQAMKIFNKGYQKKYYLSDDKDMDPGIIQTPVNERSFPNVFSVCNVKIPSSFVDDEDRLNFVKMLRMTHSYMDAVRIDEKLLPTKSDHQDAVIMGCLLYNQLLQNGTVENGQEYFLEGQADEQEARLLAGLKKNGEYYAPSEWSKNIAMLARQYGGAKKEADGQVIHSPLLNQGGRE